MGYTEIGASEIRASEVGDDQRSEIGDRRSEVGASEVGGQSFRRKGVGLFSIAPNIFPTDRHLSANRS